MQQFRSISVLTNTATVAVASLLLNTACFTYRAASPTALTLGADSRLELTAEGTAALVRVLGPRIRTVIGQVQEIGADSTASVIVSELVATDGQPVRWTGSGRAAIPLRYIGAVQERQYDRKKTWTASAVLGTIFTAIIVSAIRKSGSAATGKTPGSTTPD
jgi:hypothetical protein